MDTSRLRGILPPIPTPFDADGNILHDELRRNLARWVESGLHGFVVLGTNGEYVMLSENEKYAVWETARDAIPRDRLFIAGAGAESTRAAVTLTRRAAEVGADAALVVTPHYYRGQMNSATLTRHYHTIADASPIPVLIYNVPNNTAFDIDAASIVQIAQHENIVGMKDSSGNMAKLGQVLHALPSSFAFFAGSGSVIFPAMMLGAKGAVPALGNVAPRECVEVFNAVTSGKLDAARELQLRLIRLNDAVTSRMGVPGLKAALDQLGFYGGPPRAPLMSLDENSRVQVRAILQEAQVVEMA